MRAMCIPLANMASLHVLTFFLCVVTLTNAALKDQRIAGGEPTTIEEYPYIVAVEFQGIWSGEWSQNCAGAILTSRWILSAANCFDGILFEPQYRRIRAGSTFRNTGGVISEVLQAVNHPSYTVGSRFQSDISLIELVAAMVWGNGIQPGVIITAGFVLPDNIPVIHAGWGAVSSGGPSSDDLQHVTVYTINRELCAERYWELNNSEVTEDMICAGILDTGGSDACQGDSGGPLSYDGIIVGVVSWGHDCANATYPGVNTAVSSYTDWITSSVN